MQRKGGANIPGGALRSRFLGRFLEGKCRQAQAVFISVPDIADSYSSSGLLLKNSSSHPPGKGSKQRIQFGGGGSVCIRFVSWKLSRDSVLLCVVVEGGSHIAAGIWGPQGPSQDRSEADNPYLGDPSQS